MRTLKSMDVSPTLAMVAADYLIAECNNPRPDETTVINIIEEGITSFGSASQLMEAWLDHFGVGYVPGKYVRAVAEQEEAHRELEAKVKAKKEEAVALNNELAQQGATVEYWGRTRGFIRQSRTTLLRAVMDTKRCNEVRSVTVWF